MLKIKVDYPTLEEEKKIMEMYGKSNDIIINRIIKPENILEVRKTIDDIYVDEGIKDYILRIVFATRKPSDFKLDKLKQYIDFGASPRASLYLLKGAKALAFLKGRGFVTPDDIKEIAYDVLRHRVILSFEAEAEELKTEDIIKEILSNIEVP